MVLAEKQRIAEELYQTESYKKADLGQKENLKPVLAMVGIFLSLLIINLWVQVLVVKQNNEIKVCRETIRVLERESIQLRIEMAKLESFERIQSIAEKELGMRIAGPSDYHCIAAAPALNKDGLRPYNYIAKSNNQGANLWAEMASWFEGVRSAMAQSIDN